MADRIRQAMFGTKPLRTVTETGGVSLRIGSQRCLHPRNDFA